METLFAVLVGVLFAGSIYLLLSRKLVRILLGIAILGNAVNLLIFTAGRLTRDVPPIIPVHSYLPVEATANPLPQALVLTAIVISFSFLAFFLVLGYRAYQELGTDDLLEMRVAEPKEHNEPPLGY
ncbi:monovalent cation/H+ antiporter subunit C [Pseudovibrio sp. FO-BEG1]|uniref:Multisubunit sodium/proton antiporter, MrpC subunit n=2 Tax=Pseudovibrio TaxID=258255 RepID=A0A1I6YEX8_9HYPH|nr:MULTISPECIES: Na+/H+ antiporter subunit C [Pseudovibrio]AEV36947.1 monovalent cation/H+ antiporter subunit C [Pseudovibrio sp. FO-BEG1]EEA94287.1 Na+/H+ antiporter [Pseudovibrio sp. JE062]QUS57220.1 Na+/H+ antiporter subunit C [Pseudovibrio brasiliensis]SFT48978.1 multisubunit sodium/proton antiporter, MrpC subunit [Pseudovibrio denitrificans]